jgi:hypothetical protein
MARRSNNRTRGGARKGEPKEVQFWDCPLCPKKNTRRQSKYIGWEKGKKLRACKHHPIDVSAS